MKIGIKQKFSIAFALFVFFFTLTLTLVTWFSQVRLVKERIVSQSKILAEVLHRVSVDQYALTDIKNLGLLLEEILKNEDVQEAYFVDSEGLVLASGVAADAFRHQKVDTHFQIPFDSLKEPVYKLGKTQLRMALPIYLNYEKAGALYVRVSLAKMKKELVSVRNKNISIGIVFIVCGFLLGLSLADRITRPIRYLIGATKRISKGNFSEEIDVKTKDEFQELAESFNSMTENLVKITVSKDYLNEIIHSLNEALFVTSFDNKIITVNDFACRLMGFSKIDLIGKDINKFLYENEKSSEERILLSQRGERIPVFVSYSELTAERGKLYLMWDLTERKELESKLQQSLKMETVGQLAGGIAHDFNNLLVVILGYCDLILDSSSEENPNGKHASEIKRAAERAAGLTRQLLDYSSKQMVLPVVLDCNALVKEMTVMLERLLSENIVFKVSFQDKLGLVRFDPHQLEQVVLNLVVNARDAMPNGGELFIKTENVVVDEFYTKLNPEVALGEYVSIQVCDTGIGIKEENVDKIFEPFYTTKEQGKGTGMGLATVYGITKQGKGYIHVYSELNKGTCFKVLIPRIQEEVPQQSLENSEKCENFKGNEKILLVEDVSSIRAIFEKKLSQQGYDVVVASNGEEALGYIQKHHPDLDLLITDMVMPKMGGIELTEHLKKEYPDLRILYMSGYSDQMWKGENPFFLQKPFALKTLMEKIREILDVSKSA